MLLSQYLCWRHKNRLKTGIGRLISRNQGDYGFAGTVIPVQEPVHWVLFFKIFKNFKSADSLVVCQGKGQRINKLFYQLWFKNYRRRFKSGKAAPAQKGFNLK